MKIIAGTIVILVGSIIPTHLDFWGVTSSILWWIASVSFLLIQITYGNIDIVVS